MASMLTSDRISRTRGVDPETRETYEVQDGAVVYTDSLVGIRKDNDRVEPVDPSNLDGNPGYSRIGFTQEHSEPDPTDAQTEVGTDGKREILVEFGITVELDAETNLSGGELGDEVYAASDHEFALTQSQDIDGDTTTESLPVLGRLRDTIAGAVDRAFIRLPDFA